MTFRLNCIAALCAALPVAALAQDDKTMGTVTVTEPRMLSPGETGIGEAALAPMRAATSDTARLLLDIPGVSLYGAGGVSSLPAIRGLADDRIRIQVDGMDLMAACPNHMNSALSYIDPTRVASITVFAGITPVSVGGDSIGRHDPGQVGTAPEFADSADLASATGQAGRVLSQQRQRQRRQRRPEHRHEK
jgi:iron complex outermembrane receptor protein